MPIEIEGPDGAVIEFPDDTPRDVMQNAMRQHYSGKVQQDAPKGMFSGGDKYQQAAQQELAQMKKAGLGESGYGQRLLHGMAFGGSDEALAALETPISMYQHGTMDPREGYKYAKAFQDERLKQARKDTGALGTAAEIGGGLLTGGQAAKSGLTFMKAGQGALKRTLAGAGEGAGYGGLTGFLEGEGGLADRAKSAAKGAAAGATLGGAIPLAFKAAETVAAPVVSNIAARVNPLAAARARLGRAVGEAGTNLDDAAYELRNAAAAGQGEFTLADALGNPGQRLLSTVARAPGEGRTRAVEFLNQRQAGQAGRVGDIIDEALGADMTGRQLASAKRAQAIAESSPLYEKALSQPTVWTNRLQQFVDDPISKAGLKRGIEIQRLEALAKGEKFNPHDYAIVDFDAAGDPIIGEVPNMRTMDAIKKGIDNILEDYRDPTTGKLVLDQRGRAIEMVRKSLLGEIDRSAPDYAAARAAYAGPASEAEAIGLGKSAATRGRPEDTLAVFRGMNEPQKAAYRTGYADKLQEGIDRGAEGVNQTRKLTSPKARTELNALTLDQGPLRPGEQPEFAKRLGREQTMFETRRQAIGGSQTADNLADQAENQIDPRIFASLARGDLLGAGRQAFMGAGNVLGGNTPAVRSALGDMLLQRDPQAVYGLLREIAADNARSAGRQRAFTDITRGLLAAPSQYSGMQMGR